MKLGRRSCSTDAGAPQENRPERSHLGNEFGVIKDDLFRDEAVLLDGDETDTFFHCTGFSGLEEQFAAFGKTPFQAGPDDGRRFRTLCGVDHEAIGGKPLLPLLVQPGKVHVIAMDFGKRPSHEQLEALLEQRKIGLPIRPEEKPGKPGEQETHGEREQNFPASADISGTAPESFRPGRAKL